MLVLGFKSLHIALMSKDVWSLYTSISLNVVPECVMFKLRFAVFLEWNYSELPSLISPIYSCISVLVGIIKSTWSTLCLVVHIIDWKDERRKRLSVPKAASNLHSSLVFVITAWTLSHREQIWSGMATLKGTVQEERLERGLIMTEGQKNRGRKREGIKAEWDLW